MNKLPLPSLYPSPGPSPKSSDGRGQANIGGTSLGPHATVVAISTSVGRVALEVPKSKRTDVLGKAPERDRLCWRQCRKAMHQWWFWGSGNRICRCMCWARTSKLCVGERIALRTSYDRCGYCFKLTRQTHKEACWSTGCVCKNNLTSFAILQNCKICAINQE